MATKDPLYRVVGDDHAAEVHQDSAFFGSKDVYKSTDADTGEDIGPWRESRADAERDADKYVKK